VTAWVTADQAADPAFSPWADAAKLDPALVQRLLDAAQVQCETFAPELPADATPGASYQLAVIYQARELYAAAKRDGDLVGGDSAYPIRARPLTGAVQSLLRPQRGRPLVG
jgi:hypothetical protein